jgi:hypothetical protein
MDYIKVIKKLPEIHCARGPEGCEKCREALKNESYRLIRVYLEPGEQTRPITDIFVGCRKITGEYDVVKSFETKEKAKAYAIDHGIEIIFD